MGIYKTWRKRESFKINCFPISLRIYFLFDFDDLVIFNEDIPFKRLRTSSVIDKGILV